jgi:hypothetical protein
MEIQIYLTIQFIPQTKLVFVTEINRLMLFAEITAVYFNNHENPINTLFGQNARLMNIKVGRTYMYKWYLKGY